MTEMQADDIEFLHEVADADFAEAVNRGEEPEPGVKYSHSVLSFASVI